MKNIFLSFFIFFFTQFAFAESNNVAFGSAKDSFSIFGSIDVNYLKKNTQINDLSVQYGQPNIFMRLPGRINIELHFFKDFARASSEHNLGMIGITQDIYFYTYKNIYTGTGIGIYIKDKYNTYIGSKINFGEKLFVGYKVNDDLSIEGGFTHFSNGELEFPNRGYTFGMLGLSYYY